jgi:alcohol dehydrogenase YqhD (iron-dependent ADH family)
MNPELTYTLPQYQTQSGCADILMHTMERYFSGENTMELTDSISEALMRTVIKNALILTGEPANYEARAEIMWAGSISHNGLTGCGTTGGDWSSHQLEHELGGMFDVTHGAGLAAVWGSWARYVYKTSPSRFAQFAVKVMGVPDYKEDDKTSLEGIKAMEQFYKSIGMPTCVREMGIDLTEEQIHELAYKCSFKNTRTIGRFQVLDMEDMKNIFTMAR